MRSKNTGNVQWIPLISIGMVILVLGIACVMFASRGKGEPSPDGGRPTVPSLSDSILGDNTDDYSPMNPPSDNQEDYQQEVQLRQPSDKIKLSCDAVATYSGAFVEDGSDSQVSDIASMLITNRSSQFLQYARLVYEVDGHEAIFEIKGLSSGKSAWVLEANGLKATDSSKYVFVDGITSYLDRVIQAPEELSIQYSNNMLRVVNQSDRTLDNVVIYYKVVHTDGHYLGGITYHVNFGTLAPGDSVEKIAGHYVEDWTVIVRVGWQEAASDETS